MRKLSVLCLPLTFALSFGCSGDDGDPDAGGADAGAADATANNNGGTDAGPTPDAGEDDAGTPDSGEVVEDFPRLSCDDVATACQQFTAAERDDLLDAVQDLADGTTVILGAGTFSFDNALTLRRSTGIHLTGQGMDETTLDFSAQAAQANGVDVVGDDFTISELEIVDAKKDALRIEDSTNVIIRRVRTTWSAGPSSDNGAYGIYPVRCTNVLVEESEALNAADAGLYIGQSINVIIRNNVARANVAGIEIENTQFADVFDNLAEDNTAGLVVFDLPGNPIIGHDVRLHHNVVRNNNRANFAPTDGVNAVTTVSQIPAGTGTFALASRRVEIDNNTYENNDSVDIALLSGLVIEGNVANWGIPLDDLVGNIAASDPVVTPGAAHNFRSREVFVHDNTFEGSGDDPDDGSFDGRPIGLLLAVLYQPDGGPAMSVDNILYDGIEEVVAPGAPGDNTNRNRLCLQNNGTGTYATLDLERISGMLEAAAVGQGPFPTTDDIYRPAAPFAPFDCTGFSAGPIKPVVLDFLHRDGGAFPVHSCDDVTGACASFEAGQEEAFITAINELSDDTTLILGQGSFSFDNAVTLRRADGVTLLGQGMNLTSLDFSAQAAQSNGVDVIGDRFTIQDLEIVDAKKDALRVEDSEDVVIRRVRTTWSAGPSTENGSYGIYPVRCRNVLVEDSEAFNAADAGLYVGQVENAIVRRNVAMGNVAGIEIENTQFADVYANLAEDNTAGLAIFDLPGNPIVGRDVRVHHNAVMRNNRDNFAAAQTIVAQVPVGTGTFALASRRVELHDNLYLSNDTTAIALVSGLVVEGSTSAWALDRGALVGSIEGLTLSEDGASVANFATNEVYVHANQFAANGTNPDTNQSRELGAILSLVYFSRGNGPVDAVFYDGIGEQVDPNTPANNTNLNHICVAEQPGVSYATLDLARLAVMVENGMFPSTDDIYQPMAPFAPFDCVGFTNGPIPPVTLPE